MIQEIPTIQLSFRSDFSRGQVEGIGESDRVKELAMSVRDSGIRNPLLVVRVERGYEVLVGNNRLALGFRMGLPSMKCIVLPDGTPRDTATMQQYIQQYYT